MAIMVEKLPNLSRQIIVPVLVINRSLGVAFCSFFTRPDVAVSQRSQRYRHRTSPLPRKNAVPLPNKHVSGPSLLLQTEHSFKREFIFAFYFC